MATTYDAIIIGTGQAGPALAARLAGAGWRVAIAERKRFGGTCVNNGCIPTKTLVASARAAHVAHRAADYGVMIGDNVNVDMQRVKTRKDAVVERSRTGVEKSLRTTAGITVYDGHARFESAHTVRIGDDLLEAEHIFINVGGRAYAPPMPGLGEVNYLDNSSMMDVDFLPEHLVIVGGSYIGLEFGQMYRRFGSRVTIIEKMGRLIAREDEDVSDAIKTILENEGIGVHLDANCIGVARHPQGVAVNVDCDKGDNQIVGSHLLLAVGRTPNTDDLGLDKAGIETDKRGYIEVDDQLRTNVAGVYALGDCNGKGAFTHTAYNDYEIAAANLLDNDPRRVSDRITAYALYIDPPLGRCGMTEEEVRQSGKKALIGKREMARVGRAIEKGETQGFMKIVVDAETKKLLGASLLGIECDEIIHSLLDVMYASAPYTVIQRAMHIHPTVSELIPTMLGELKPLE
ncbi:MAG TPA: FAD-containing oxidoreductase [Blastocatellia bacterium]|nr:FAD-containing oxidoreductase [Blastocatellia bacterium]